MKNGKPEYREFKKPATVKEECLVRDRGQLGGYCAGCGLMRMKHETGACPKCGGSGRTQKTPPIAGRIFAVGHTKFTQYTVGNEAI